MEKGSSVSKTFSDELADIVTNYVCKSIRYRRQAIIVQNPFFLEAIHDPYIEGLAQAHKQNFIDRVLSIVRRFNSDFAEIDAEIFIILVMVYHLIKPKA